MEKVENIEQMTDLIKLSFWQSKLIDLVRSSRCTLDNKIKKSLINGGFAAGISNIKKQMPILSSFVESQLDKIIDALVDMIDMQYEVRFNFSDRTFESQKAYIFLRQLYCIIYDVFGDMSQIFLDSIMSELKDYVNDNIGMVLFAENILQSLTPSVQIAKRKTYNNEYFKFVFGEYNIPLNYVSDSVRLFHGTSKENWIEIKKSGYIKGTNYRNIIDNLIGDVLNNGEEKKDETGSFVLFEQGIDKPLVFARGGKRYSLISMTNKNFLDTQQDELVILELANPGKYQMCLNYLNEFMVMGTVDIADVIPYFLRVDNGLIVGAVDDKGVDASERILYF